MNAQLHQAIVSGDANITLNVSAKDLKEIVTHIMYDERKRAHEEAMKDREIPTLSRKEVANMIGVSLKTLHMKAKSKELIPTKVGIKVRYRLSDVEEYLQNNRQTI